MGAGNPFLPQRHRVVHPIDEPCGLLAPTDHVAEDKRRSLNRPGFGGSGGLPLTDQLVGWASFMLLWSSPQTNLAPSKP
jgi:hypothetical protein